MKLPGVSEAQRRALVRGAGRRDGVVEATVVTVGALVRLRLVADPFYPQRIGRATARLTETGRAVAAGHTSTPEESQS